MKKTILITLLTFIVLNTINAQSFVTIQTGKVVYNSSSTDRDSIAKKEYAALCNKYISKYYSKKKLPLVYMVLAKKDSAVYKLSYDNLMGNSINNNDYERKGEYDKPGLRILIYSKEEKAENILKMLEYGLAQLKELKRLRKHIMKKEYYDQPDNLSIRQDEILSVIKSPASHKVKEILKD